MRILLVGDANSIFFVHYVKALKKQMDVEVDVYSPIPDKHNYSELPYDRVFFDDYELKKCSNIRFLSTFYNPYVLRSHFGKFLKHNGIKYDIMHFHWIVPEWVICPKAFRKYADKICVTLWGGEFVKLKLLKSHELYLRKLKNLLKNTDALIGGNRSDAFYQRYPFAKDIVRYGLFGSSIIDILNEMPASKEECKKIFGADSEKITVMPGYSGKALHNQDKILKEIINHADFEQVRDKIHFLFPMTRGSDERFLKHLEEILNENHCHYTMIKGTYMSDEAVAQLRKATDVMFQLSDFDGLSSSIKESLCAGSVLISGNWFKAYGKLKDWGFKYLEVESLKEGIEKFYEVVGNLGYYKDLTKENTSVGVSQFSWNECIKDWVAIYKDLTHDRS